MNRSALRTLFQALAIVFLLTGLSGCAIKIEHLPPLTARPLGTEEPKQVNYPGKVISHNSRSFWDAHQVKDNIVGVFELEFIRVGDILLDRAIPGRSVRPLEGLIEFIKHSYAQLPDWAPVRIIDGLFSALGLEKMSLSRFSIRFVPRLVYLTDWVQDTLGEVNVGLGHLVPWPGPFIPTVITNPPKHVVDWLQNGAMGIYVWISHKLNIILDVGLDYYERGYGAVIKLFVSNKAPTGVQPTN